MAGGPALSTDLVHRSIHPLNRSSPHDFRQQTHPSTPDTSTQLDGSGFTLLLTQDELLLQDAWQPITSGDGERWSAFPERILP